MKVMGRALTARIISYPVSAVAAFVLTGMIIRYAGTALYGVIMLVASLFLLMPFADLGTGAAVVNAFSDPKLTPQARLQVAARVVRVLMWSALAIIVVAWLGAFAWSWADLLGVDATHARLVDITSAASLSIYGLSLPPSIGMRILVGSGRATTAVLISPLGSLAGLVIGWALIAANADALWLTTALPGGILIVQVALLALALRAIGASPADLLARSDYPLKHILQAAAPMLVIMVTLPFALQAHRIVLSLRSDPVQLADYSLAMQFYTPIWGFISAAATPLWPMWATLREDVRAARVAFSKALRVLLILGLAALLGLVLLGDLVGQLVSGGAIRLSLPLLAVTGLLLCTQALQQAPGMYLTTPAGLRFQSYGAVIATGISLLGSWSASPTWGAVAPSAATAVGIMSAQTIPGLMLVARELRRPEPKEVPDETADQAVDH